MELIFNADIAGKPKAIFVALSLWVRVVSGCQGAVQLVERGMTIEARTLLRTAFEHLFFCAALLKDHSVLEKYSAQDMLERVKQANAILNDPDSQKVLPPEQLQDLRNLIDSVQKNELGISIFDAAKQAGLISIYHGAYRILSLVAAHSTFTSAGIALDLSQGRLIFGPSMDDIEDTLGLIRDLP